MDEQATLVADKPRWWHSRRRRQQVLRLPCLVLLAAVGWQLFANDQQGALQIWLVILSLGLCEWLLFRFFDPNYPVDDSKRHSDKSYLRSDSLRWWQSRARRRKVLATGFFLLGVTMGLAFELGALKVWTAGSLTYLFVEWAWFRIFDANYPDDDLEPGDEDIDAGETLSSTLFWIAVMASVAFAMILWATFWKG